MNDILDNFFPNQSNLPSTPVNIDEFLVDALHPIDFTITQNEDDLDSIMLEETDNDMIKQVEGLDELNSITFDETDEEMVRQVQDLGKTFNCQSCGKKFARKQHMNFHKTHCNRDKEQSHFKTCA